MKVTAFIIGKVEYDKFGGQYFWVKEPKGGSQMLAEMRGWGHIQNMFPMTKEGQEAAGEYQDKVGDFIADAINEKIERISWIKIEQRKPIATQSGDWDGLKSEPVLVADKDGKYHVAVMYEGNLDGGYFCEFLDDRDFEIKNVAFWMKIPD